MKFILLKWIKKKQRNNYRFLLKKKLKQKLQLPINKLLKLTFWLLPQKLVLTLRILNHSMFPSMPHFLFHYWLLLPAMPMMLLNL